MNISVSWCRLSCVAVSLFFTPLRFHLLFVVPDGLLIQWRGLPVKKVRTAFRKARKRVGLSQKVNTYSFRRGVAKWMRAHGVDKWEVEGQFGHRKGTTDRYATVAPEYLQKACAAIESYWAEVPRHLRASGYKKEPPQVFDFVVSAVGLEPTTP
jgi:integrase